MADVRNVDDLNNRLTLSVAEASLVLGISRSRLYEEISSGRLKKTKLGRRTLVLVAELKAWLEKLALG